MGDFQCNLNIPHMAFQSLELTKMDNDVVGNILPQDHFALVKASESRREPVDHG